MVKNFHKAWLIAFFLSFLLLSNTVYGSDDDDEEDEEDEDMGGDTFVKQLTGDSFATETGKVDYALVAFTAPWCGHCKSLHPEFEKAAETLKDNSNVILANIDATVETELAEEYQVQGYPTIKWKSASGFSDYNGGRTAEEIVNWIKKKTGPPAVTLADEAAVKSFLEENSEVAVVGFFAADGADKEAFLAAARDDDDNNYGLVTDAAVAGKFEAKAPGVAVFKSFDEKRNNFDGKYDAAEISEFISAAATPLLMEFNDDNVKKIFGSKIPHKALLFVDTDAADFEALKTKYRATAEAMKGKAVFAYVNKDKEQVLEYFGITTDNLPQFYVLHMDDSSNDMAKYKADGVDDLTGFVQRYLDGKVDKFLKTEEIPENNDGPVKVVVGKNFDAIVLDETKDVLIEFYAPWCGHCKSLAPKYEKLGKKFSSIDSIVIAKADATANDFAADVQGFPTILFYPANDKSNPVNYDGARTVKGMTKFLKENASVKFELPKKDKKTDDKKADDSAKEDL